MQRQPQRVRFKLLRTYSVEEAARKWGVHKHTIRSWLKTGLVPIDKRRPTLILGRELNRFLDERRERRRSPCPLGTIYCLPCRAPKRPAGNMVDYLPSGPTLGNLRGLCPDCLRLIHRRVALASVEAVAVGLEVAFPEGRHSIRGIDTPSQNRDFKKGQLS